MLVRPIVRPEPVQLLRFHKLAESRNVKDQEPDALIISEIIVVSRSSYLGLLKTFANDTQRRAVSQRQLRHCHVLLMDCYTHIL